MKVFMTLTSLETQHLEDRYRCMEIKRNGVTLLLILLLGQIWPNSVYNTVHCYTTLTELYLQPIKSHSCILHTKSNTYKYIFVHDIK